jgi:hypothetical protein
MYWGVTEGTGTLSIAGGQLCVAVTANEQVTLGWPEDDNAAEDAAAPAGVVLTAGQSYTFSYAIQTTTTTGVTVIAKVSNTNGPDYTPLDFQAMDPATNLLEAQTLTFTLGTTGDTSAGLAFTFTSSADQSICIANVSLSQN